MTEAMRWRRKISLFLSRRFRKIICVVLVSAMISLAVYNQFGENVSTNSKVPSLSMQNQVIAPKPTKLKRDLRNPKINRSLKRLSLDERLSNVHYITIDSVKPTRKIVSSSRNVKIENVDVKRSRESHKRAIKSQFHYTQMAIENRGGLFDSHVGSNNKIINMHGNPARPTRPSKSAAYIKGSIRFYAKPEWFSTQDIESMITLSANGIIRADNAELHTGTYNWKVLIFPKDNIIKEKDLQHLPIHQSKLEFRGLTSHALSLHEVLAFHLDRVLGLGRALPTVAKFIKGTISKTLNIPDNSLHSILAIGNVDIQSVDGLIKQNVLACKSIQLSDPDSAKYCGDIDGIEWGKLALFDFLLQIHDRLNKQCCGFQPDSNNECFITIDTKECSNPNMNVGIVHKDQRNNKLIFLKNDMNLKSSGSSIDFEILKGVRKFPIHAVDIIRKGKLKLMLLQSLFIDKAYWDGVGGRPGVENMINLVVTRAKLFLEHYDKHMEVQ